MGVRNVKTISVCALALLLGTGCAFIKPTTELKGGPFGWRFTDTKDNNVLVKNAEYDPKTGQFSVEEVNVSNQSSPVIEANVQQMLAFVEQQRAANEAILGVMAELRQAVGILTGGTVELLRGSQAQFTSPQVSGSVNLGTQPAE